MAWPVMESEAELVLVSHQLRRFGGWRPWLCLQVGEAANADFSEGLLQRREADGGWRRAAGRLDHSHPVAGFISEVINGRAGSGLFDWIG